MTNTRTPGSLVALLLASVAGADTLYAISYEGTLCSISTSDGSATPVRATLPPPYQTCDSLEFSDGWFYASYSGGRVVRFGFACGDEVDLGPSGFPWIEAIARRADGTLFAAVSQNNDVGAESIGILDAGTGDLSSVVASGNQAILSDMDSIAFSPAGVLMAINLAGPRVLASIDPATGAVGPAVALDGSYAAMAWTSDGTLYALDVQSGSCTAASLLVIIDPVTGAETLVGPTGFVCMTGLTRGPNLPAPSADLNGDGRVDGADLGLLLAAWGPCGQGCCPADLNLDGLVDGADLGLLLAAWAP